MVEIKDVEHSIYGGKVFNFDKLLKFKKCQKICNTESFNQFKHFRSERRITEKSEKPDTTGFRCFSKVFLALMYPILT